MSKYPAHIFQGFFRSVPDDLTNVHNLTTKIACFGGLSHDWALSLFQISVCTNFDSESLINCFAFRLQFADCSYIWVCFISGFKGLQIHFAKWIWNSWHPVNLEIIFTFLHLTNLFFWMGRKCNFRNPRWFWGIEVVQLHCIQHFYIDKRSSKESIDASANLMLKLENCMRSERMPPLIELNLETWERLKGFVGPCAKKMTSKRSVYWYQWSFVNIPSECLGSFDFG